MSVLRKDNADRRTISWDLKVDEIQATQGLAGSRIEVTIYILI